VLIFDEATSNLDTETAAQIARTANRLKGAVSVFFIAHQFPPGLAVDRVVELGTKTDLGSEPTRSNP
jgi:subfamily B ATP-binding cassette protein HlyB/CyaB